MTDQPDISPETADTFPSDPISSGTFLDTSQPDAMVGIRLHSGRLLVGAMIQESANGVTIKIEGWEYTLPWTSIEHVAVPPHRPDPAY
jgi:hypothetical protein